MANIITKPWGEEIILTTPDLPYTAKIIKIKAGKRLSLQYHNQKTETLTLISGRANLIFGPSQDNLTTLTLTPQKGITITPNTVHRLEGITDAIIFEASTPEIGTTFRLQDDYSRPNEKLS